MSSKLNEYHPNLRKLDQLLTEIIRVAGGNDKSVSVMRELILEGRMGPIRVGKPISEYEAGLIIERARELLQEQTVTKVNPFG